MLHRWWGQAQQWRGFRPVRAVHRRPLYGLADVQLPRWPRLPDAPASFASCRACWWSTRRS